ncbi:MAG: methyltransferase [Myxococcota bacterium]
MDLTTRRLLDGVNRRFYREHAVEFSATRGHPWPGWRRVVEDLPVPADRPLDVLDVGCGNGRLVMWLAEAYPGALRYTGTDSSVPLLEEARRRHRSHAWAHFAPCDFIAQPPATALPGGPFDWIAVFGVLHHVPSFERRRELLEAAGHRLEVGGRLTVSLWQFVHSPKFQRRMLPWEDSGLAVDPAQLERGDHLLRWGDAGAFRYCHFVDDAEWAELARATGLRETTHFDADGAEARSNRYVVLERSRE